MCNGINGFVGVSNGKTEQPACTLTANGASKKLVLHMQLRFGSISFTSPLSLPANEFDVQSVLHGQMSLAAVNQFCVIHEAMNSCKKIKDSLKGLL